MQEIDLETYLKFGFTEEHEDRLHTLYPLTAEEKAEREAKRRERSARASYMKEAESGLSEEWSGEDESGSESGSWSEDEPDSYQQFLNQHLADCTADLGAEDAELAQSAEFRRTLEQLLLNTLAGPAK